MSNVCSTIPAMADDSDDGGLSTEDLVAQLKALKLANKALQMDKEKAVQEK